MDPELQPTKLTYRLPDDIKSHLTVEVTLHDVGKEYTPRGQGIFCYYVYVYEKHCPPELFERLWLEDRVVKSTDESEGRLTYDRDYLLELLDANFYGGITYYRKHGHTSPFRCVQLGADFNHCWDQENPPKFSKVKLEALQTRNQIHHTIQALQSDVSQ
jgi:hypothetical protein